MCILAYWRWLSAALCHQVLGVAGSKVSCTLAPPPAACMPIEPLSFPGISKFESCKTMKVMNRPIYRQLHVISLMVTSQTQSLTKKKTLQVSLCFVLVPHSEQKNWFSRGQMLLVSQITAQRTKLNLWEFVIAMLGILSFVVPNNKHSDFLLIWYRL